MGFSVPVPTERGTGMKFLVQRMSTSRNQTENWARLNRWMLVWRHIGTKGSKGAKISFKNKPFIIKEKNKEKHINLTK